MANEPAELTGGEARIRAVMQAAAERRAGRVGPASLLCEVVRLGTARLRAVIESAAGGPLSISSVDLWLASSADADGPAGRVLISSAATRAIRQYKQALQSGGAAAESVGWELLADCAIQHLEPDERAAMPNLNTREASRRIRELISQTINQTKAEPPTGGAPTGEPFDFPDESSPGEDLTHRARASAAGKGSSPFDDDPAYEVAFETVARTLHRRTGNHVLLTGERGVGIGTLLAELARRAMSGAFPFLASKRFLLLNCRHTAPEESLARLAAILTQLASRPELVVCVEGFAALLRGRNAVHRPQLLSLVSRVSGRVIGVLSPREYEEFFGGDEDFAEFFTRIDVHEPDPTVALKLLRHFAAGLEDKFSVSIDPEAVRQSVVLSANYILNDQLPGKALRILHRVCEDLDFERAQLGKGRNRVEVADVVRAVSHISGVPEETLRGIADRCDYEQSLGQVVFGQDHAVREVAGELGLIKAGMTERGKPASVMLFVGQTGTGKTELAKALARFYSTSKRLKTYTLGNFVESHSVAGIIGVPPGYVGNDQGGRLINDLNSDPYGVFLLDEVDKAHPDVLQPFLNLFDEGWIADQRGTKAYANRSIFILTTNVGQRMIGDMFAKGQSLTEISDRIKETLTTIKHTKSNRPVFTPEFLARIKRIIVFNTLSEDSMRAIAGKVVAEIQASWLEKRNRRLTVSPALVDRIGRLAHQKNQKAQGREGGRLVRKMVSELIESALQREMTARVEEYRAADQAYVEFDESVNGTDERGLAPAISVRFSRAEKPPQPADSPGNS